MCSRDDPSSPQGDGSSGQAGLRKVGRFASRWATGFAVEKDYWVSEVLRVLARNFAGDFIFKGGTSLSKGCRIVERWFSPAPSSVP
jgi:predicted nucleotidyltransferase component of viral defense system